MAVISFGEADTEIFLMKRRLLRLLLEKATDRLADPADEYALKQASAVDGLLFERTEPAQARRLAVAVAAAAAEIREGLDPDVHAADQEFDVLLRQIEARVRRLVGGPSKFDAV